MVQLHRGVLGPDATLQREYSITMNERGKIIRTIAAVRPKMCGNNGVKSQHLTFLKLPN
jgi:hypothetical protein